MIKNGIKDDVLLCSSCGSTVVYQYTIRALSSGAALRVCRIQYTRKSRTANSNYGKLLCLLYHNCCNIFIYVAPFKLGLNLLNYFTIQTATTRKCITCCAFLYASWIRFVYVNGFLVPCTFLRPTYEHYSCRSFILFV